MSNVLKWSQYKKRGQQNKKQCAKRKDVFFNKKGKISNHDEGFIAAGLRKIHINFKTIFAEARKKREQLIKL
jgi:hypothetical protein